HPGPDRHLPRDRAAAGGPVDRLRHLLAAGAVPGHPHQPRRGGRDRRRRPAAGPGADPRARLPARDRDHAGAGVHVDLDRVPHRPGHGPERQAAHRPAGPGELPGPVHLRDRPARRRRRHRRPAHRDPVPVPPAPLHPRNARRSRQVMTDRPTDPDQPAGASTPAPPEAAGCQDWDPLAAQRTADDPPLDVLLSGTVFFDIVFTGMDRLPQPGEELWSKGMGSSPGGIANLATAAARLGLRTGLVAGFGDDAYADWMWHTMAHEEGIDLTASRRFADFHSALTVSIAAEGDRAMATHGHDLPEPLSSLIAGAPDARAAVVDLAGETSWWAQLAQRGSLIFADIGFDATGRWDVADLAPLTHCHAFTPNAPEAMAYTRTESPDRAVRALAEMVPLAVVTDGAHGSYAIDSSTGEEAYCPAVPVHAIDTTGAGDVFAAAIVLGTLADWPLEE